MNRECQCLKKSLKISLNTTWSHRTVRKCYITAQFPHFETILLSAFWKYAGEQANLADEDQNPRSIFNWFIFLVIGCPSPHLQSFNYKRKDNERRLVKRRLGELLELSWLTSFCCFSGGRERVCVTSTSMLATSLTLLPIIHHKCLYYSTGDNNGPIFCLFSPRF